MYTPGILPTCQDYYNLGVRDEYSTMYVDPDGVEGVREDEEGVNVDPFPVLCYMAEDPPVAKTLIGTNYEHLVRKDIMSLKKCPACIDENLLGEILVKILCNFMQIYV